jgi:nucleoside-diphosphate-sugar epimerase
VSVTGSYADFERVNVEGTSCLLAAMHAAPVSRLVHVSSPSVANAGRALVGVDAAPADPAGSRGPYARSKAVAEQRALAADTSNGGWASVIAIRPHLVWGPGDTQLVARVVERARRGRLALVGRGNALIDTTYVDNAVDALCAALDRTDPSVPGQVHGEAFVVSNGEPRTVAELVTRICAAAEVEGPRLRLPFPLAYTVGAAVERIWPLTKHSDEPPMTRFLAEQLATAHWFDQRRTQEGLRWSPAVSLDEGFVRLAAWFAGQEPTPAET